MNSLLVVARYQEPVEWLGGSPWPVRVVQKGRELPNVGREAGSYLWFMATQEIDPGTTYAFVQGDPWPHAFRWDQLRQVGGYVPLGGHRLDEDEEGRPNHPGLPLARCLREWLGAHDVPRRWVTVPGAQFLVDGRTILSRPREFYQRLLEQVCTLPSGPWVMERLWPRLWVPQSRHAELLAQLHHGRDPYAGLVPREPDEQGWNGTAEIFGQLLRERRPELVVEVGTWKGQSALTMAGVLAEWGGVLLCVDTWLGSLEFMEDPVRAGWLDPVNGYPSVYYRFLSNVVHRGLQHVVVPCPQTSANAARWLARRGLRPGLVYVDGSHEEADVAADVAAYWALLEPGGVLLGDDHDAAHWPGVVAAVVDFAAREGVQVALHGTHWVARKPG